MQLPPSPYLANIIKHFLILESDSVHHRLFPDGNSGMTFHYGDPFNEHPRSFIYGQISKYHNIVSNGKIGLIVVVFQPYGASALINIPANELTDTIISIEDLWGYEANVLEDKILNAENNIVRIKMIEAFLFKKLYKTPDDIVKTAVEKIYHHHGLISVTELKEQLQINERLLERKFSQNIGLSPKNFANTIRLQYFLKLLQQQKTNLTHLAYESGYYDQAHLIREFKKNVGITPRKYINATNLLAVNFIQI